MQKRLTACLFDLDGTLADTAADLINALDHVLDKHGLPKSNKYLARQEVSHGANALLKFGFADQYPKFNSLRLRHELLDFYANNLCHETILFAHFETVLKSFSENNIPWGIVTNKPAFLTDPLLVELKNKYPILKHCKCIISADTYAQRKPFAVGLLAGASALGITPNQVWYLGDSWRDIDAGIYASMSTIAVSYGYIKSDDDITHWGADKIIDCPSELLQMI